MRIGDRATQDEPAVLMSPGGVTISFSELDAEANRMAHFLRRAGLAAGDTVAILMENSEHVHVMMWAARRGGYRYTMVNTHLTAAEVAYIVRDSGARAVIGSAGTRVVCARLAEHLPEGLPPVVVMAKGRLDGWASYPDCVVGEPTTPLANESEGVLLQYSSGSTGRPKGIARPRGSRRPSAPGSSTPVFERLGVTARSVYLSPAPLYHTAPAMWTMSAQAVGATTVVMERFDPVDALDCIQRHRVTHAQFVPAMFVKMLRLPDRVKSTFDLSSLERVVHAAAPCPPDIKRQMIDWWGPIIDEYYGSSEGVGISFIRAEEWLEHPGSVGRPLLGIPHILDVDGAELPPGHVGDIYYEGGYEFTYLNDDAKTAASRSRQGWVTVGDVGYLDAEGYLYLTDRRHHMIVSGGVNIYPQEAENVLVSHPLVADAAVFGVPDEVMGQSVVGVVELAPGAKADSRAAEEILGWTRDRLARFKCPRTLFIEERLPRTDAGKLYKQSLIEKYSEGAG
jgi:fatty-acyl-CoA synthase